MEGQPPQQQPPVQQQPPGWYPNPEGPGKRYWDGNRWTGSFQADKEDHTTRNVLIAVGAIVGVMLLFAGGCAACGVLTIGAGSGVVNEIDKEFDRNAITSAEYRSLEIGGVTKKQVIRRYGEPESSTEAGSGDGGSDCIDYHRQDGGFLDSFHLCFDPSNGKLRSKSKI